MKPSQALKQNGIFWMLLAAFFFSWMGTAVKSISHLPFMEIVFFRAFVSLVILTPWLFLNRIPRLGKKPGLLFVRSISGFTALCLSFYVLAHIPLGTAALLNQTSTFFVALLSGFFLKEKITPKLLIYICIAFVGAALLLKPGGDTPLFAGMLGVASGFFAAIAYVSIRQLHKTESFYTMVFNFSLVSSVAGLVFGYSSFVKPQAYEAVILIAVGLFGTVAQLCMTYAYKYTAASIVNPYSFAGVLFSFLWGILFWSEIPDGWAITGAVLMVVCGIGILRIQRQDLAES